MKNKKITAILLAAALTASALTGCGERESNSSAPQQQSQTDKPSDNDDLNGSDQSLAFNPADTGMPVLDKYEYPYMGMNAILTEALRNKMLSKDVVMMGSDDYTADGNLKYAFLEWFALTEEQKNEEVTAFDPNAWKEKLSKIGTLGAYHVDSLNELDTLTGCTQHKEVGKSADGMYVYYLSFTENANASLKEELEKTDVTLTEMKQIDLYAGKTAFSEERVDATNVGSFQTTDIDGKTYTNDIFKDYDLTLVNVFTTWCTSCIDEMPALEAFKKEMAAKGINVVGLVYDTITATGDQDSGAIEKAKLLQEKAGLTFPLLMPDKTDMNGRLKGIDSYPESFFVDKNGNIVGEKYMGTRSFEEWKEIAEKELAKLKGNN